jgi:hypothetical protein
MRLRISAEHTQSVGVFLDCRDTDGARRERAQSASAAVDSEKRTCVVGVLVSRSDAVRGFDV